MDEYGIPRSKHRVVTTVFVVLMIVVALLILGGMILAAAVGDVRFPDCLGNC